jgi:hypothetical protein
MNPKEFENMEPEVDRHMKPPSLMYRGNGNQRQNIMKKCCSSTVQVR